MQSREIRRWGSTSLCPQLAHPNLREDSTPSRSRWRAPSTCTEARSNCAKIHPRKETIVAARPGRLPRRAPRSEAPAAAAPRRPPRSGGRSAPSDQMLRMLRRRPGARVAAPASAPATVGPRQRLCRRAIPSSNLHRHRRFRHLSAPPAALPDSGAGIIRGKFLNTPFYFCTN